MIKNQPSIDAIFQEDDDTEATKAKDATPEQWGAMHQRLAQRKEDRKFDIEANEAIQLARSRNHPMSMPMAKVEGKANPTKPLTEQVKPSKRKLFKTVWYFIKTRSTSDWLFIFIMAALIYFCIITL